MRPEDQAQKIELEEWERRQRDAIQPEPAQASAEFCTRCDEPIPPARQKAVPGVQLCVPCQNIRERFQKRRERE